MEADVSSRSSVFGRRAPRRAGVSDLSTSLLLEDFGGIEPRKTARRPGWAAAICRMALVVLCMVAVVMCVGATSGAPSERQRYGTPAPALHAAAAVAEVAPELFYKETHAKLRRKLLRAAAAADQNKDSKLSLKEISVHVNHAVQKSIVRFHEWDADHDRVLYQSEIKAALKAASAPETAYEKWQNEYAQMDLDGDGKLTKDEFVGSACKPCIMMALDTNRDRFIDLDELLKHEYDAASFGSVLHWLVGDMELMAGSAETAMRGAITESAVRR